jgi:hypothetical protein
MASHIAWLKRGTAGMFGHPQGMACTLKNTADQHFCGGEYAA